MVLGRSAQTAAQLAKDLAARQGRWPAVRSTDDRGPYARATSAGHWGHLREAAERRRAVAESALGLAETARASAVAIQSLLDQTSSIGGTGSTQSLPAGEKFRTDFADRLKAKGRSDSEVKAALVRLDATSARAVFRDISRFTSYLSTRNDEYAAAVLSSLAAAEFALAVACLNEPEKMNPSPGPAAIDGYLERVGRERKQLERAIASALRRNRPASVLVAAENLRWWAADELVNAATRAAIVAARRRQSDSAADDWASRAVAVGDAIRDILRSSVLAGQLRYVAAGGQVRADWRESVVKRRVRAATLKEPATVLGLVRKRLTAGIEYSVVGTVASIAIVHKDRKPYSSATITDADGHEIVVAVPKIKLDSGGLAVGGAVRARGRWATDIRWVAEGRGLLLSFAQDTALAATYWPSWVTVALRPAYRPVAHGLALDCSWEPGVVGAGNPLVYGVWSSTAEAGFRRRRPAQLKIR